MRRAASAPTTPLSAIPGTGATRSTGRLAYHVVDSERPKARAIASESENELKPSSSQPDSNSLLPTSPYQNWCPASCTTTPSGVCIAGLASRRVPAVKSAGYSMPPAALAPHAGSTTVMWLRGYSPNHKP